MSVLLRPFHGLLDRQHAVISQALTAPPPPQLIPLHIVKHSRRLMYRFGGHFHPYVERLMTELVVNDVAGLQALNTSPGLSQVYFDATYAPVKAPAPLTLSDVPNTPASVIATEQDSQGHPIDLLPKKELDFDYASGAYAVYNWELFYHIPFLVATQLSKNQRFQDAQQWFHYIFNPTDNGHDPAPARYWKVKPLQISDVESIAGNLLNLSTGLDPVLQAQTVAAISAWRANPFKPHLVARTRPTAYMYATVMAYLDNLIAWGDSLFRQETREAINEATQYYVLAAQILGPAPQVVPTMGSTRKQAYQDLREDLDEFGNAVRDLEADVPFDLMGPGLPVEGSPKDRALESLGRSLYFCIPRNTQLLGYWTTVADRLYKIRNSLNLAGIFRQLPLYAPPIDPGLLARAVAAGVDVASLVAGTAPPLAPVRFQLLLQKAVEAAQEVKSLGGQLLAAIEKKDNEALGLLRAQNETRLLTLAQAVKYGQWQEAKKNREGIVQNLANAFERFRYYDRLLGADDSTIKLPDYTPLDASAVTDGTLQVDEPTLTADDVKVEFGSSFRDGGHKINASEGQELDDMEGAQIAMDIGTVLDGVGAVLSMIPQLHAHATPFGCGVAVTEGGLNLSGLFSGLSAVSKGIGGRLQHEASMAGKMGSYDRREQEWSFQRRLAAGEVTQIFKQYRSAELREYIAQREYDNHQQQINQSQDIEDFLTNDKRKTTNEGFYLWMKGELKALYGQAFQFAFDLAKTAERAYQFETGDATSSFVTSGYLAGREGLLAGEKLYQDLKRLDEAYLMSPAFLAEQMTKTISLREWFPAELWSLRRFGSCQLDIPEALFDLDCPGHYFRQVVSVAVTVPCVAGPDAAITCRATLGTSYIRTVAQGDSTAWYPADPTNPDPTYFAAYTPARTSMVTSSAQNDTGLFETNLRDEHYLPFEGAGVMGRWTLELPSQPRQFDYETIADLKLTIRYRARPGIVPANASAAALQWLRTNSVTAFSLRHEFPAAWAKFVASPVAAGSTASLSCAFTSDYFPYRMQPTVTPARQLLFLADGAPDAVNVEILREGTSLGQITLAKGEGAWSPPAQAGTPGTVSPIGTFEFRCDSNALDDLWVVFDWDSRSPPTGP